MGMVNETFKKKIMMKSEVAHTLWPQRHSSLRRFTLTAFQLKINGLVDIYIYYA